MEALTELFGEAEAWVGVGLVLFLLILVLVKVPQKLAAALDARGAAIKADLDEAARLRTEAEGLLASIAQQRAESERQSARMLADAQAEARRLETEGRARLEEQIARRAAQAERRIALAETQAAQAVKAAAADLAARTAEVVLARRVAEGAPDPLIDRGIAQIAGKLQ
jgi:F-type H+-transporting ATPase subunit b